MLMTLSRDQIKTNYEQLMEIVGPGFTEQAERAVVAETKSLSLEDVRALDFYGVERVISEVTPSLPHLEDPASVLCIRELVQTGRRMPYLMGAEDSLVVRAKTIAQAYVQRDVMDAVCKVDPAVLFVSCVLKNMYVRKERPKPEDNTAVLVELACSDPIAAQVYVAESRLTNDGLFGGSAYALYGFLPQTNIRELRKDMAVYRARVNTPDFLRSILRASGMAFADMHMAASLGIMTDDNVKEVLDRVRHHSPVDYVPMPRNGCPARHNIKVMTWAPSILLSACEALVKLEPKPSRRTNGQPPKRR